MSTPEISAMSANYRGRAAADWHPTAAVSCCREVSNMADGVVDDSIINLPCCAPQQHFSVDTEGITNEEIDGRLPSSYFGPVPRPGKCGRQMEFAELTGDQIEPNQFVSDARDR